MLSLFHSNALSVKTIFYLIPETHIRLAFPYKIYGKLSLLNSFRMSFFYSFNKMKAKIKKSRQDEFHTVDSMIFVKVNKTLQECYIFVNLSFGNFTKSV